MSERFLISLLYVVAEGDETTFCKQGQSASGVPHGRLRILNQGNPRDLRFESLWIGPAGHITHYENRFKNTYKAIGGGGRTEWYKKSPREAIEILDSWIEAPVFKIVDPKIVPYKAKNAGSCPIGRLTDIYEDCIANAKFDFREWYITDRATNSYGVLNEEKAEKLRNQNLDFSFYS